MCYDDCTKIADLSAALQSSPSIALFVVQQDLFDPRQYSLLNMEDNVTSLLTLWQSNLPHAKLVLPIHPTSTLRGNAESGPTGSPAKTPTQDVTAEELDSVRRQLAACRAMLIQQSSRQSESSSSSRVCNSSIADEAIASFAGKNSRMLYSLTEIEQLVLDSPHLLLSDEDANRETLDSFLLSFFHHVSCLTDWLERCKALFQWLLANSIPLLCRREPSPSSRAPSRILNIYHLFEAFDAVYVNSLVFVEHFRGDVNVWLSKLFLELSLLPIYDSESLRTCAALVRQGAFEHVSPTQILRQSIEKSLLHGIAAEDVASLVTSLSAAGNRPPFSTVLLIMENIVTTFSHVVADLLDVFDHEEAVAVYFDVMRKLYEDIVRHYFKKQSKNLVLAEHILFHQFFDKILALFSTYATTFNDHCSIPDNWISSLRLRKAESAQQTCEQLVQAVKTQFRTFADPNSHMYHNISCSCNEQGSSGNLEAATMKINLQVFPTSPQTIALMMSRLLLN